MDAAVARGPLPKRARDADGVEYGPAVDDGHVRGGDPVAHHDDVAVAKPVGGAGDRESRMPNRRVAHQRVVNRISFV